MGIWEVMEFFNILVDVSDLDISVIQIQYFLQIVEVMCKDGKLEWMQVIGVIYDFGKFFYFFGSDG